MLRAKGSRRDPSDLCVYQLAICFDKQHSGTIYI